MRSWIVLINLIALICASGCGADNKTTPVSATPASGGADNRNRVMNMAHGAQPAPADAPRDAQAAKPVMFQVDVFRISVPFGTFTGNEAFWKRMDEQCVDAFQGDLLNRNGIRVGLAPNSEIEFFKRFMEEKPVVTKLTTTATEVPLVEIEMQKELPHQTISFFNPDLRIQDYEGSSNVLNMSFQPAPRKPGCMRLTLAPMVRSTHKHYTFTKLNNEVELQYINPETYYDLKLRVDIPQDQFFIVMPSADARYETSVGSAFLTKSGPTDRLEQILLIIPRAINVDQPK